MLKKINRELDNKILLPVLIETYKEHTEEEVVGKLKEYGGEEIEILAPGFISATATRACIKKLAPLASVEVKLENLPR